MIIRKLICLNGQPLTRNFSHSMNCMRPGQQEAFLKRPSESRSTSSERSIGRRPADRCENRRGRDWFYHFFLGSSWASPPRSRRKSTPENSGSLNIPVACNRSSADFMISSPLMMGEYERFVPNYGLQGKIPKGTSGVRVCFRHFTNRWDSYFIQQPGSPGCPQQFCIILILRAEFFMTSQIFRTKGIGLFRLSNTLLRLDLCQHTYFSCLIISIYSTV